MRIFIRFGHDELSNGNFTGSNGTPTAGTLSEKSIIDAYGPILAWNLHEAGHTVKTYRSQPGTYSTKDEALNAGIALVNSWGADLLISCHANAFNTTAHGTEVIYKKTGLSKNLAINISSSISRLLGTSNRGALYGTNYGELNFTTMPAIIIEPIFCDNQSDCTKYLTAGPAALANAISSVVLNSI